MHWAIDNWELILLKFPVLQHPQGICILHGGPWPEVIHSESTPREPQETYLSSFQLTSPGSLSPSRPWAQLCCILEPSGQDAPEHVRSLPSCFELNTGLPVVRSCLSIRPPCVFLLSFTCAGFLPWCILCILQGIGTDQELDGCKAW